MDQVCELVGEQKNVYASVLREVRAQVMGEVEKNGLAKSQLHILAGLTRLRRLDLAHSESPLCLALRPLRSWQCLVAGDVLEFDPQFQHRQLGPRFGLAIGQKMVKKCFKPNGCGRMQLLKL